MTGLPVLTRFCLCTIAAAAQRAGRPGRQLHLVHQNRSNCTLQATHRHERDPKALEALTQSSNGSFNMNLIGENDDCGQIVCGEFGTPLLCARRRTGGVCKMDSRSSRVGNRPNWTVVLVCNNIVKGDTTPFRAPASVG